MHLSQFAPGTPWAIRPDVLRTLATAVAGLEFRPAALATTPGQPVEGSPARMTVRDGVATIPIHGPMFARGTPLIRMLTSVMGGSIDEDVAADFTRAIRSNEVGAILLDIDSPGGEVDGSAELSALIHAARGTKPVAAYAMGSIASKAYWVGSAADELVIGPTTLVGSVGVVAQMTDDRAAQERAGIKEISVVSSNAPHKRIDLDEPDHRTVKQLIDELESVFTGDVARNRGVDLVTVLDDFGRGGVLVGEDAVKYGLADRIGSYESLHAELVARARGGSNARPSLGGPSRIAAATSIVPQRAAQARSPIVCPGAFSSGPTRRPMPTATSLTKTVKCWPTRTATRSS